MVHEMFGAEISMWSKRVSSRIRAQVLCEIWAIEELSGCGEMGSRYNNLPQEKIDSSFEH